MTERRVICDVCGKPGGHKLTEDDRRVWPAIASWVRNVCDECRARFRGSAGRAA